MEIGFSPLPPDRFGADIREEINHLLFPSRVIKGIWLFYSLQLYVDKIYLSHFHAAVLSPVQLIRSF